MFFKFEHSGHFRHTVHRPFCIPSLIYHPLSLYFTPLSYFRQSVKTSHRKIIWKNIYFMKNKCKRKSIVLFSLSFIFRLTKNSARKDEREPDREIRNCKYIRGEWDKSLKNIPYFRRLVPSILHGAFWIFESWHFRQCFLYLHCFIIHNLRLIL